MMTQATTHKTIQGITPFLCLIGLLFSFGSTQADPVITSAGGAISGNSTITISGSGFGSTGPKIVLFDDFEGGTAGQPIDLKAPVGSWSGVGGTAPVYSADARTGTGGFLAYDSGAGSSRMFRLNLGGDQTEVFYSFWVRIPDGSNFPGRDVTGPKMFSSDSSWKFSWLMDGSDGYNSSAFDMCFPTHTGGGNIMIAGNDYNLISVGNSWWSWSSWMRISVWVRGGTSLLSSTANSGFFQTVSQEKGLSVKNFGATSIFQTLSANKFSVINMPGWIRAGITDSRVRPVHDDVYVAVGRGAVARVEIADAPTYSQARNVSIVPVTSWQSAQITAKVPQAGVGSGSKWYLYVTDADGRTNTSGFPLSGNAPNAPTSVTVD